MKNSEKIIERFWSKVDVRGTDECWPWIGSFFDNGYGAFAPTHDRTVRAHRFACQISGKKIKGKTVRHSCDFKPCCNPAHLTPGTNKENVEDRDRKGRQARGISAGAAKLSEADVLAIRADARPSRDVAKTFGVCKSSINNIRSGNNWKHLVEARDDAIRALGGGD